MLFFRFKFFQTAFNLIKLIYEIYTLRSCWCGNKLLICGQCLNELSPCVCPAAASCDLLQLVVPIISVTYKISRIISKKLCCIIIENRWLMCLSPPQAGKDTLISVSLNRMKLLLACMTLEVFQNQVFLYLCLHSKMSQNSLTFANIHFIHLTKVNIIIL